MSRRPGDTWPMIVGMSIIAAGIIGFPMISENTADVCNAAERRFVRITSGADLGSAFLGLLQSSFSNGAVVRTYVQTQYPNVPPFLACYGIYYRQLFDPSLPGIPFQPKPGLPTQAVPPNEGIRWKRVDISRRVGAKGEMFNPSTVFQGPIETIAVRLDYENARAGIDTASFNFVDPEGPVVKSCGPIQLTPGNGSAWCNFNLYLSMGQYKFDVFINNGFLVAVPFTVN